MEPEHEHFWAVTVDVGADKLDARGMAIDFSKLKARISDIISQLDGATLNGIDYFRENCATAESMAAYIYTRLEPILPDEVRLEGVRVSEQIGCSARYHE
jgi:6-pyruvoyl-tetrahydropterin synthase